MYSDIHKSEEEKIILKSKDLFSTYGIRSVSMDDISSNLGISKKTLYRFVKDKEELVDKVVTYNFDRNATIIQEMLKPEFNAIDEILTIVQFFINVFQSHPANMIFDLQKFYPNVYQKFKIGRKEKLSAFYNLNFKKGMEEGLYRENLDTENILKIILILSEALIENDNININESKNPKFILEFHTYHLFGIVSETGYSYLKNEIKNIKLN